MTQPDATPVDPAAPGRRLVSRRAVGRAAVWSVPVIASVTLAPAAAAASGVVVTITQGPVCLPGQPAGARGAIRFTVTVQGTLPLNSVVTLRKFRTDTGNASTFSGAEFDVPAGFTKTNVSGSATSANTFRISNTSTAVINSSFAVDVRDAAFTQNNDTYFTLTFAGPPVVSAQTGNFTEGDLNGVCT